MRQRELRFRQTDKVTRVMRGHRERQRLRIGEAHVLAGQDHQPSRDEPGILTACQHLRQPIHGGVGIAAAATLDERGNRIVVLIFIGVVTNPALAGEHLQIVGPQSHALG